MVILFVILTFVGAILIGAVVVAINRKAVLRPALNGPRENSDSTVFDRDSIHLSQGIFFSKGHTWIHVEKDGNVKIGIDDFLNKALGDFRIRTHLKHGSRIRKGEPLAELELNGKALKVISPIEGTVRSINHRAVQQSSIVKDSPYDMGWLVDVGPADLKQTVSTLEIGKHVVTWMKTEVARLKEFLSAMQHQPHYVGITMYDGGNITEGVVGFLDNGNLKRFEREFLSC